MENALGAIADLNPVGDAVFGLEKMRFRLIINIRLAQPDLHPILIPMNFQGRKIGPEN